MTRALLAATLIACGLLACSRDAAPPAAAPATEAPATAPAQTVAPAPADAATASQESSGDAAEGEPDAALERLATMPAADELPSGRWKAGVNYKPIVPAQPTDTPAGKVEVMEVFWYGCGHCYALEPYMTNWEKTKPAYIEFVRMPVMWNPVNAAHARLYYTLVALKRTDLNAKVFDEIHTRGNMLAANDEARTRQLQLAFAKANGIAETDFLREYDGFFVNTQLKHAEETTRRYRVDATPVVFVAGKYQTDVGLAGGQTELTQLIDALAAHEKRR
ncbi:MAG TPA: thiol:disulfide interchange protein DsbA/DsbL [Steroidobacteraceae bacterium]|nr:thiol:disulfide interchange protein DsbA/DsbL [Steroidobacteraceae bacterium]HQW08733.1 thiol:disulfide interchange protein DsbA/DsbL [Steroidobacteraceae bacterium]HQX48156.1 thiol:disulfide interchange protein DsbA/DsbL [Steroidobacteraceae bacterium]HQX77856.1 thiol:disulfide interchange protein DsbA/DsbL [Steroidobacteraceae bacterium]HQZ81159.1 thiol:disulfide interchange protein DsbA/DsbL [Steroidobacteraceae bacterium]